jgi:hypothetical protein
MVDDQEKVIAVAKVIDGHAAAYEDMQKQGFTPDELAIYRKNQVSLQT